MRIDLGALAVVLQRRPWSALATAWLVCLLGWTTLVWSLVAPPPVTTTAPAAEVVGAVPPPPAVVRLRADLARAQALGAEVRLRLKAMPATLPAAEGGGANPLHLRLRAFLSAQGHLIAALERRLVAAGQAPAAATVPPSRWAAVLVRPALPLLVLATGAGLGLLVVAWHARRAGVIAGVAQLQAAVDLPVLGQVTTVPAATSQAWRRLCAGPRLAWAGLLAAWAVVTVITVLVGSTPAALQVTNLPVADLPVTDPPVADLVVG